MRWWERDGAELGEVNAKVGLTRVLVKHTIYLSIAILCMRFIEWLIEVVFGEAKAASGPPAGAPHRTRCLCSGSSWDCTRVIGPGNYIRVQSPDCSNAWPAR